MEERIGNVVLDYTFYKGTDQYSDGEIEDVLLSLIQKIRMWTGLSERIKDGRSYIIFLRSGRI